ncbi:MAG: radical SAM protein [Syntrophaceae bacterium]
MGFRYSGYDVCLVQDCNLRCKYCSTGYGRWGNEPKIMSLETIDRLVQFMIEHGDEKFRISFSGGETLYAFDKLQYFIEKMMQAKKEAGKKVQIGTSTNGLNLTEEIADYLTFHKVNLTFSIDGDKVTNDRNRVMSTGRGVYDTIRTSLEIYRSSLERNGEGNARIKGECTVDEKADLFKSVLHLFDIGIHDVIARPADDSLLTGYKRGNSFEVFMVSFRRLVRFMLESLDVADIILDNQDRKFLNIQGILPFIITGKWGVSPCEIITKNICIMADGKITPCFLFNDIHDEMYEFGDIFNGVDWVKVNRLLERLTPLTNDCMSCWCRSLCKVCYRALIDKKDTISKCKETQFCWITKKSTAIVIEEVARRYGTQSQRMNK